MRTIKDEWGQEAIDKFWSSTEPDLNTGCINWKGTQAGPPNSRYGHLYLNKRTFRAHVYSMILTLPGTEIPPGQQVNHSCNNKLCVNPQHLYLGTQQNNIDDIFASGNSVGRNAKLDINDANEIIELYRSGETMKKVAKKYGVVSHTIARVLGGKYQQGFPFIPSEELEKIRINNISITQKRLAKRRKKPRKQWSKWYKRNMRTVENAGFKTIGEYNRYLRRSKDAKI